MQPLTCFNSSHPLITSMIFSQFPPNGEDDCALGSEKDFRGITLDFFLFFIQHLKFKTLVTIPSNFEESHTSIAVLQHLFKLCNMQYMCFIRFTKSCNIQCIINMQLSYMKILKSVTVAHIQLLCCNKKKTSSDTQWPNGCDPIYVSLYSAYICF